MPNKVNAASGGDAGRDVPVAADTAQSPEVLGPLIAGARKPKRALILAGGGMKVAWQAGVLQVLLDEVGDDGNKLDFDIYDAASGGVFQLAMLCQGMTGTQIADNWRGVRPAAAVGVNWAQLPKLMWADSLLTLDNLANNTWADWGLDFDAIRRSTIDAGFNVYNFTDHRLEVRAPKEMDADWLRACVSLPGWFPSVVIDNRHYIDSVFATDGNLERAIAAGADELWVIWTVSRFGDWRPGYLAEYFQVIEAAANGRYLAVRARIDESNRKLRGGEHSEWNRQICVREIRGEVPLHYLLDLSRDRFAYAVNMGVVAARTWCARNGYSTQPRPIAEHPAPTSLVFTEEMKGSIGEGVRFYTPMQPSGRNHHNVNCRLTITIDNLFDYIQHPDQWAHIGGWVNSAYFGGERPVEDGRFGLFWLRDTAPGSVPNPIDKRMLYRLCFQDKYGELLTLHGEKFIRQQQHSSMWRDTTTMFVSVFRGEHLEVDAPKRSLRLYSGVMHISLIGFLRQLATMRVEGTDGRQEVLPAMTRFGAFFLGNLWDVYGRKVLDYGPW